MRFKTIKYLYIIYYLCIFENDISEAVVIWGVVCSYPTSNFGFIFKLNAGNLDAALVIPINMFIVS